MRLTSLFLVGAALLTFGCGDDTQTGAGASGGGGSGSVGGSGGTPSTTGGRGGGSTTMTTTGVGGAGDGPSSTRLVAHEKGSTSAPQGFYEYIPPGYPNEGPYPLLVAHHGIGENGNGTSELTKVINVAIGKLIAADQWSADRPFVILIPQHEGGGCPGANEIKSLITWGMANYTIDAKRVYLTGLSCGAIGSFGYLAQELDSQIAAFVPIAGNGIDAWNSRMCDLGKVPIWAFHGDNDGTVNFSGTNIPMDGLADCPSPPRKETKKTIYPGVDHNSWDRTYDGSAGHDIYAWMLSKQHD